MPSFSPAQNAINAYLLRQLQDTDCVRGRLEVHGESAQVSFWGQKPDGRVTYFRDQDQAFDALIGDYLQLHWGPEVAHLFITVEVEQGSFEYSRVTWAQQEMAQQQEIEAKKNRSRRTTPYGSTLAKQVADALRRGHSLGYNHRDYCGMGLDYAAGKYRYVEINDGYPQPTQTFNTRDAFVAWLAQQSDKTLARLEEESPRYWDNQTITQQRLEELVAQ